MKASAGRVLMLVENQYPRDTRVRNEATALASRGLQVSVIALGGPGEPRRETVNGVTVYRLPRLTVFKKLPDAGGSRFVAIAHKLRVLVGYVVEYLYFTTGCLVVSGYVAITRGFDVVHAHNPPDTLFVVGAVHKVFGKRFVFDHHDLSPELYRSRYTTPNGWVSRGLAICEKASVALADVLIATNESYRGIDISRNGIDPSRVFIVRNGPDLSRVRLTEPDPVLRGKARVVLGYLGAMNPQDGVDYMLRALHHLRHTLRRSDFHAVAIGDGDSLEALKSLSADLGLADRVTFTGFIPDEEMVRLLSTVDICLDPNPSNPLNDVSTWIKVMEYMALGKPLVSFGLKETRVSAGDAALYATPNDVAEFAEAVARLMDDEALRKSMGQTGRRRVEEHLNWAVTSQNLVAAYRRLFPRWTVGAAADSARDRATA
jgi:glycosyltransferase involved in cell wall biosynthesis